MLKRLFAKRYPPSRDFGPKAHDRIQSTATVLSRHLKGCTRHELEALIRFYVHGQEEVTALDDTGITTEEFQELRRRLHRSVAKSRKPANARAATAN